MTMVTNDRLIMGRGESPTLRRPNEPLADPDHIN